jgi:hypothetical protein
VANSTEDVLRALALPAGELHEMAHRARERTLAEHTGMQRALAMLTAFEAARSSAGEPMEAA